MPRFIKLYTLNTCGLLYTNFTSKKVKERLGREKFRNSEFLARKGRNLEEIVEKQGKNLREN